MKRMMIFIRSDTQIFGSQVDSYSTQGRGDGPPAEWEIGEMGVTLIRKKEGFIQIERVPWANIAKLSEHYTLEEYELELARRENRQLREHEGRVAKK